MATTTITLPVPGSRPRWLALGLAGGILIAAIAGPAFAPRTILGVDTSGTPPEHTISVTGTGRVVISPDVADLRVGVSVNRPTVKAARGRMRRAALRTSHRAALKAAGIADKDIQTSAISLQPQYDYSNGGAQPRLTGYYFSNSVSATVRDLDKLGDAIDGALAAGATTLDSVLFRVDDQTKAEAQARAAAMADAKAKADALASAAGVSITGVSSISETIAPTPYPIMYGATDAAGRRPRKSFPRPSRPAPTRWTSPSP